MKYICRFGLVAMGLATWSYFDTPEKYPYGLFVLAVCWAAVLIGIALTSMPDPQPESPAPEPPKPQAPASGCLNP